MACFSAICGGAEKKGKMAIVVPEGLLPTSVANAEKVEILAGECMIGLNSLACASYPALLFRLKAANANVLKSALAKALKAYPICAGRMQCANMTHANMSEGGTVALTNAGVPFTVVQDPRATAPDLKDERVVLQFGDYRCPRRVAKGLEPILTFMLTIFRDGTAVLGMCRTHAILDGTSAWDFLNKWAAAARGEVIAPGNCDRSAVKAVFPTLDGLQELAVEVQGQKLEPGGILPAIMGAIAPSIVTSMDVLFIAGCYSLGRPRIFFSDAEVARIKEGGMPTPDGNFPHTWVSTQEALAAYLLLTVAKATLKPSSEGKAMAMFWLDPRKAMGWKPDYQMGLGFNMIQVDCGTNITQKTLPEVAGCIHNFFEEKMTLKDLNRRFRFFWGAVQNDMHMAVFQKERRAQSRYDVVLQFNNQSKRKLPDFGAGGGQTSSVLTDAGPTLAVPADGGIDVYMSWDMFGSKKSNADAALKRLRDDLPQGAGAGAGQRGTCGGA